MWVVAVVTLLAALPSFGACFWPAPYAVRESYHLHFAPFEDHGADEFEMVLHDAACSQGDSETELSMRELDAHAQLDTAPDDLDFEDAWYPTDYDEHSKGHRKRGLDADSLRVGRLVVNGQTEDKAEAKTEAKPKAKKEAKAKDGTGAKDDNEVKDNTEAKDDGEANDDDEEKEDAEAKDDDEEKEDAEAKDDTEAKDDAEAKDDTEAKDDGEIYDYAALRHDYDAEMDALATPSADAVTGDAASTSPAKGIALGRVHEESGRGGGWTWPKLRVGLVSLVALGVYVVVAVPCYCQYGLCCCCFFWVPLCRPRDVVRRAKRFAAQNPPGVMRIEAVVDVGKDVDAEDEDEIPDGDAHSDGSDDGSAQATAGAADLDGPAAARQARRRAVQAAAASEKRYRPSRGELDAYNALMDALRGL